MPRKNQGPSESQLDALIARIHGLTSSVGKQAKSTSSSEGGGARDATENTPDEIEASQFVDLRPRDSAARNSDAGVSRPDNPSLAALFREHVPPSGAAGTGGSGSAGISSSGGGAVQKSLGTGGEGRRSVREQLAAASDNGNESSFSVSSQLERLTVDGAGVTRPLNKATSIEFPEVPDFEPSRDEPWRPLEPQSLGDVGVPESSIEQLILKFWLARGEEEGRQIADQVKLPFRLVEPILEWLKMEQSLAHKRGTSTGDFAYVLTDKGRGHARSYHSQCTYFGACPVPLRAYVESVKKQTVEGQKPQKDQLERAFSDLLINPKMLDRLGPAVNSGRGMFLYGFPGNGKTSIAERMTAAFGKWIWIPRAIDVDGDILRVYDRMNHDADMPDTSSGLLDHGGLDKRWIRVRRPTIVAGGELTMDMLEVQTNSQTNISEAPLQLKSNCGTLVIDDFGRQKMSVDQLLNRWIVPLEKRYDFLNMRSGKKIQVPFDQLVVFSTNLEPRDLVDDAFLRRIPYKIEVANPTESEFRKLFEIMCRVLRVPFKAEPIDYLIATHYKPVNRPYRNCQPRDLLLQVQNYCRYHGREVELRDEYFDFAVENYFSIM